MQPKYIKHILAIPHGRHLRFCRRPSIVRSTTPYVVLGATVLEIVNFSRVCIVLDNVSQERRYEERVQVC